MIREVFAAVLAFSSLVTFGGIPSGEEEAKRQARSVHLFWQGMMPQRLSVL